MERAGVPNNASAGAQTRPHFPRMVPTMSFSRRDASPQSSGAPTPGTGGESHEDSAARSSEASAYRLLFDLNPDPMWVFDTQSLAFLEVNEAAVRHYGFTRQEFMRMTVLDIRPEEDAQGFRDSLRSRRGPGGAAGVWRHRHRDGRLMYVEVTSVPMRFGQRDARLVIVRDVTEGNRVERELRESESRFRMLAERIEEVFFISDFKTGMSLYVSPAYEKVFGRTVESALAKPLAWMEAVHPEDVERVRSREFESAQASTAHSSVFRVVHLDGAIRWVRARVFPVPGPTGAAERLVGIAEDITELRSTEEQLRHAQKMEAIGRLSGGVAHDFNNLLTAIMGYSQIASLELRPEDPLRRHIEEIQKAGERAGRLTRQLLAFSRQQVMELRVVDLSAGLTDLERMLHRILGEDVELRIAQAPGPLRVMADPTQLDQVLVNLAVNARDAMPGGGRLSIETCTVEYAEPHTFEDTTYPAGKYAVVAVSDTGTGIAPEFKGRIFEPFFTTKELGKGTGLGLSMVYGIVKQTGGFIRVYSEVGHGTTFKIYLPTVDAQVEPTENRKPNSAPRGTETLLIVEDEGAVTTIARVSLERRGYRVLVAANGGEALLICERHRGPIHLLLTDVVMPGMSGPELAKRLAEVRPGMPVLFMSGYPQSAGPLREMLDAGACFLEKPFTPSSLAWKVRETLDCSGPSTRKAA